MRNIIKITGSEWTISCENCEKDLGVHKQEARSCNMDGKHDLTEINIWLLDWISVKIY